MNRQQWEDAIRDAEPAQAWVCGILRGGYYDKEQGLFFFCGGPRLCQSVPINDVVDLQLAPYDE